MYQEDQRAEMKKRPFAHMKDLMPTMMLLHDLLETREGVDRTGESWFTLVEQPWSDLDAEYKKSPDHFRQEEFDEEKYPVSLRDRDLYIHVDGARVKGVPSAWGNTASVIKFRLSGLKQGMNQLGPLRGSS